MPTQFETCITAYWKGEKERCRPYLDRLTPLFSKARDRIDRNMLSVLNDRRYLRIIDPVKRMRRARNDPKMKQVSAIIAATGKKSVQIINGSQDDVYKEEAPLQAECWTESTPDWASFSVSPLTDKEGVDIINQPYLGRTYNQHAEDYTNSALKTWSNDFMSVQVGKIQEVGKASHDVQLVSGARTLLDTMETRSKTVMENACINTARWIDKQFLVASGQA